MEIFKRVQDTNSYQLDRLAEFMVQNPRFAKYRMLRNEKDKLFYNRLWEQLKDQLNARGPARPIKSWKLVWSRYKFKLKHKIVHLNANEKALKRLLFDSMDRQTVSDTLSSNPSKTVSTINKHVEEKSQLNIEGTNRDQCDCLMTFMVDNPIIAGQSVIIDPEDNKKYNILWADLTLQLNRSGPPIRAIEGWKRVWEDYKEYILKSGHIDERLTQNLWIGQRIDSADETAKILYGCIAPIITLVDDENPPVQVEQPDMLSVDTDELIVICDDRYSPHPTPKVATMTQPTSSLNVNLSGTDFQDQVNVSKELDEVEKELDNIKRAKIAVPRQKVNLKEERLYLKRKLHILKDEKCKLKTSNLNAGPS